MVWLHEYEQSEEMVQLVLRTLGSVFRSVMLFRDHDFNDLIAVASRERLEPDFVMMERRFDEPAIRNDLARIGISNLAGFLSHHAVSQSRFPALTGPGPLNTVAHQRLEYRAPRSFFRGEVSDLVKRFDPLVQGGGRESDVLLDRYIAYRAAAGDPVRAQELVDVAHHAISAGRLGKLAASPLFVRARLAPDRAGRATRPAHGAVPKPAQARFYEASYWARRLHARETPEAAIPFYRRALELQPDDIRLALALQLALQGVTLSRP